MTMKYTGLEAPTRLQVTAPQGLTELTDRGGAARGGAWRGGPPAPPPPPPSPPHTPARLAPTSVSTTPAAHTHTRPHQVYVSARKKHSMNCTVNNQQTNGLAHTYRFVSLFYLPC